MYVQLIEDQSCIITIINGQASLVLEQVSRGDEAHDLVGALNTRQY